MLKTATDSLCKYMELENITLTPAEMLLAINKKAKVQELIKFTFYDLLIRGLVKVERLETETSEHEFFITSFSDKKGNIKYHEEIFFNVLSKEEGLMSLKKLVFELSNYSNEKFRKVKPQYIYEEIVLKSLLKSRVYIRLKKRFLLIFKRSKVIFTDEGLKIANSLRSVRGDYPDNWLFLVNKNFKNNADFFESKFFLALEEDFQNYFWDGIKSRHIGLSYSGRGSYPNPVINNKSRD